MKRGCVTAGGGGEEGRPGKVMRTADSSDVGDTAGLLGRLQDAESRRQLLDQVRHNL